MCFKKNNNCFNLVIAFCLLVFSSGTYAEDLLDVYRMALMNDASYKAAQLQYAAAAEAIPQARSALLPEFALRADRTRTKQNVRRSAFGFDEGETRFYSSNVTLSLTQPIVRYDAIIRYRQSKVAVDQAKVELSVAEQDFLLLIAESYFNALAAQDRLELARVEKTAVSKYLDEASWRKKTGMGRVSDLHDAKARYALSESNEIEAENLLEDSYQSLRERTDVFVSQLQALKENMLLELPEPAKVEHWVEQSLQNNTELEARRLQLEVARHDIDLQKTGHYPTLDAVISGTRRITDGPAFGSSEGDVESKDYMLRLTVPFYAGGAAQSRMREAFINLDKAKSEYEAQRRRVVREARAAYRGVITGINKVKALKQSIISQESALKVKTEGHKAGVNKLLEVLDAQRELHAVKSDYFQSRYEYLLSTLKLKRAAGSLVVKDLEKINSLIIK